MGDQFGLRLGVSLVTHQMQKQIDGVSQLIQQRTTAVERPSPPPGPAVIVFPCPSSFYRRLGKADPTEPTRVDRLFQNRCRRTDAAQENAREADTDLITGSDHLIEPFNRHFERLLSNDVFARSGGGFTGSKWAPLGVQIVTTSRP